ncbi:hypothetical protein K502DRAFT_347898 [Neoconidiobolus thromboides FSU 785]|nr:hypothetical protein K502DRAFT_347898 [Neoconidiobolus thromboides FSU 785]
MLSYNTHRQRNYYTNSQSNYYQNEKLTVPCLLCSMVLLDAIQIISLYNLEIKNLTSSSTISLALSLATQISLASFIVNLLLIEPSKIISKLPKDIYDLLKCPLKTILLSLIMLFLSNYVFYFCIYAIESSELLNNSGLSVYSLFITSSFNSIGWAYLVYNSVDFDILFANSLSNLSF